MRKYIVYLIVIHISLYGCVDQTPNNKELRNYYFQFHKINNHDVVLPSISMIFNLSCSQIFGGATTFTQNSIAVTGASASIQVINNYNCTLTLSSFFDGTSTYNPQSSSLVISITATGQISSSGSLTNPAVYQNSQSANIYFFLVSSSSSSLSFEYAYDPAVEPVTFVNIPLI